MALPELSNVEGKITQKIADTLNKVTDTISRKFTDVTDSITDSLNNQVRELTGWRSMGFDDIMSGIIGGSVVTKFSNLFNTSFSRTPIDNHRLEELVEDLKDTTGEKLDTLDESFNKLAKKFDWGDDRQDDEELRPRNPLEDTPLQEQAPKFNFNALIAGLFKNLFKLAAQAVSVALIGASITAAVIDGIKEWKIGEQIGEQLGLNDNVGGIVNTIIGNAGEGLMSKFARYGKYAAAGAALGAIGFLPGIIVGGMLGLATGVVIDAVTSWIGKEKIYQAVDKLTDMFFSGLEYLTGTNVKRLERRIKDLTRGKGDIEKRILDKQKEIIELEKKISKAREEGKNAELQRLLNSLKSTQSEMADLEASSNDYDKRINEMRTEIKDAKKGLIEKTKEFGKKTWDYILSIPIRWYDTLFDLVTGEGDKTMKTWTMSTDDIWKNSSSIKAYNAMKKWVIDFADNSIEAVKEFFTVTIPQKYDEIVTMLRDSLSKAFDDLMNLADAIVSEISVRDFLPESLGGNEEGLFDRVKKRVAEAESESQKVYDTPRERLINENTDARDNLNESIDQSIQNTTNNDNSKTSNHVHAPINTTNNVINKRIVGTQNSTKNIDSTARLMDLAGSGAVILP